jgi:dTDP-4-amino-4,6-dideoxy-D-galactose acyltransferase
MFRFVDVRVALELQASLAVSDNSARFRVRDAIEEDIPNLRELARVSHRDSRFYYDGNFSDQACDQLYETWIEKSCRGWANRVLVAEEGGHVQGYLTCLLPDTGRGQIGLVAVSDTAQGKGIGAALVTSAIRWFATERAENVSIVTQGRNVRAQRFYQRCGFAVRSVEFWFHRWFLESRNPR